MMKLIIGFFFLVAFAGACHSPSFNETSEDTREGIIVAGNYGEGVVEKEVFSTQEMYHQLMDTKTFNGKVLAPIKEVCANKGCWLTIELPEGNIMRVTFKDYGFFVPKESGGYPVILKGVAKRQFTDVATLRHYAEDAGKSKEEIALIDSPKEEFTFEAAGVLIKDKM